MEWSCLKQTREECQRCPRVRGRLVPHVIKTDCRLMFVAEAPGEEEAKPDDLSERFPLTGPSGKLFDMLLSKAGIDRSEVTVANVCACWMPGNPTPTPEEIAACSGVLEQAIGQARPKVIVALGGVATTRLVGKRSIMGWRGSVIHTEPEVEIGEIRVFGPDVFKSGPRKGQLKPHKAMARISQGAGRTVVLTNHPAELLPSRGGMTGFPLVKAHILRAKRLSEGRPLIEIGRVLELGEKPERLGQILEASATNGSLTIDFETDGLAGAPSVVGVSLDSEHGAAFNVNAQVREILERALPQQRRLVGQNLAAYDLEVLRNHWGLMLDHLPLWDTMHGAHFQRPDLAGLKGDAGETGKRVGRQRSKDLGLIVSRLHEYMFYNWKQAFREKRNPDILYYCAMDAAGTSAALEDQEKDFKRTGRLKLWQRTLMPLLPVLVKMQRDGVPVDVRKRDELLELESRLAKQLEERWDKLAGIDPNSPKQLMEHFYGKLGLTVKRHPQTNRPTLNRAALEELFEEFPNQESLRTLIGLRHVEKMLSTYLAAELDASGRLHPYFDLSGTETGRLSGDLQQVPKAGERCRVGLEGCICPRLREIFAADQWVCGDFSQIENKITALLARDREQLDRFEQVGYDQHSETAASLGVDRHTGKTINHALDRMAGWRKIQMLTGVDKSTALRFINGYRNLHPRIVAAREEWIRQVQQKGWIANPWGRRMFFPVGQGGRVHGPAIVSFMPQSTAAEMMLESVLEAARAGLLLLASVHDELDIESRGEQDERALREIMQRPRLELGGWGCSIELGRGRTWAEAKR